MSHKPDKFNFYLNEISKFWGSFEIKDNNLFIKYSYDKKISNSLKEQNDIKVFDLQYGIIQTDLVDDANIKNNIIKNVSLDQLKKALIKHKIMEDDAEVLAEQIKLKEFSQTKATGKEFMPKTKTTMPYKDEKMIQNENKIVELEIKNREYQPTSTEQKARVGGSAYNKNQASNDAVKKVLLIKIDALQDRNIAGVNGGEIREKLLHALENGISPSVISIELEKIELRMSQEYRMAI